MNEPLRPQPRLTCEACGRDGAYAFDGETLCADCVHQRGSCCAGDETCPSPKPDMPPSSTSTGG